MIIVGPVLRSPLGYSYHYNDPSGQHVSFVYSRIIDADYARRVELLRDNAMRADTTDAYERMVRP